ncbi:hypothetical protein MJO28_014926 [Puccinia striiformis f. sp. tritici]|uniref:Uncharacterized protein n=3 Tax=Puccinia striiformis TaxID=27350 RepID=A0A0L0VE86_9BASI|nr:hypothetical protein MJO28_014926 [Puccinia striiformis f. sp. tritici]KNE97590.1 hypothetical protein PSTG_09138 [Puccinia striiformis f. sp. tritici PST-78]POV99626.1 hypothetical protein PSHT_13457 [Puccinia striiformis]
MIQPVSQSFVSLDLFGGTNRLANENASSSDSNAFQVVPTRLALARSDCDQEFGEGFRYLSSTIPHGLGLMIYIVQRFPYESPGGRVDFLDSKVFSDTPLLLPYYIVPSPWKVANDSQRRVCRYPAFRHPALSTQSVRGPNGMYVSFYVITVIMRQPPKPLLRRDTSFFHGTTESPDVLPIATMINSVQQTGDPRSPGVMTATTYTGNSISLPLARGRSGWVSHQCAHGRRRLEGEATDLEKANIPDGESIMKCKSNAIIRADKALAVCYLQAQVLFSVKQQYSNFHQTVNYIPETKNRPPGIYTCRAGGSKMRETLQAKIEERPATKSYVFKGVNLRREVGLSPIGSCWDIDKPVK